MTRSRLALAAAGLALLLAALATTAATSDAKRTRSDRNADRIPDRWERGHGLSLKVNQARRDQDSDGLRNREEYLAGTDPRDRDSDDDGTRDADEGAGRIVSFADGVLVVEPFGGGEAVKAKVDARTDLGCERRCMGEKHGARSAHRGGEDEYESVRAEGELRLGPDRDGASDDDRKERDGDRGERDDDPREDDDEDVCLAALADLKPGAVLHEASLEMRAGGAFWTELRLVRTG